MFVVSEHRARPEFCFAGRSVSLLGSSPPPVLLIKTRAMGVPCFSSRPSRSLRHGHVFRDLFRSLESRLPGLCGVRARWCNRRVSFIKKKVLSAIFMPSLRKIHFHPGPFLVIAPSSFHIIFARCMDDTSSCVSSNARFSSWRTRCMNSVNVRALISRSVDKSSPLDSSAS